MQNMGWIEENSSELGREPLLGRGVVLLNDFYLITCRDKGYFNSDHPECRGIAKHLGHSGETTKGLQINLQMNC